MGYLFGTGIIGAITAGMSLLRGSREQQWTWRLALAWLSWGITLALAVGAMIDLSRERRGIPVSEEEPLNKETRKQLKRAEKQLKKRDR